MTEDPSPQPDTETERKARPYFRIAAVAILGILALILVMQNTETVETRLLVATVAMPRAVLLVITFLIGVIVGLLIAFLRRRKA